MKRIAIAICVVALAIVGASPAAAHPGLHQHKIVTPGGNVALPAQGFCMHPELFAAGGQAHRAFENFHGNVHLGPPPAEFHAFC